MRNGRPTRQREQGAVLIIVALSLLALVAMAGLVLDLGQLFVSKTELQNAADACALAGARELNTTPTTLPVVTRAENAAITVGIRHTMGFQHDAVVFATDRDVTFSNQFTGAYVTKAGAPTDTRYVRCTTARGGILPWLIGVLGIKGQQVSATAVASLQGSTGENCGNWIPLAMCRKTLPVTCTNPAVLPTANGLCKGQWYLGRFSSGGGEAGNFNWIDFSPHAGGAQELVDWLEGYGKCINLDPGAIVHAEPGVNQAVETAWDSRFGLYRNGNGQPSKTTAPPDFAGYAYTTTNWAQSRDAYPDFLNKRDVWAPYDFSDATPGVNNSYSPTTSGDHKTYGADRRIVKMVIVDCAGWGPGHTVPVLGVSCALMLNPNGRPNEDVGLEFIAEQGQANNPCAGNGTPGGPGGSGPAVPGLVQ